MSEVKIARLVPNPEHMAKLNEGIPTWNNWYHKKIDKDPNFSADLSGADLSNFNLENIFLDSADLQQSNLDSSNLTKAHLHSAILDEAYLDEANLQHAQLDYASLENSSFTQANLNHVNLENADLKGSNLQNADIRFANLSNANLSNAQLRYANLFGTNLQDANLEGADLGYAKNIRFSDNRIKNIIITSTTTAPWLTLKKTYTNTMLIFTIAAVFAFFLPYVVNAAMWRSVNFSQKIANELKPVTFEIIEKVDAYKNNSINHSPEALLYLDITQTINESISKTTPCLEEECQDWEIWQLLLGVRRNWGFAILSLLLILYNILRIYLTQQVSILRDSEQTTGLTPRWNTTYFRLFNQIPIWPNGGYQHLYYLHHYFVRWVFWIAVFSLVIHSYEWLRDIIQLPLQP